MDTNVECLSWGEVEALGYLQLSDIRMQSTKELVEQSCKNLKILEHVIEFQTRI